MPNYTNPRTQVLIRELAFATPAATSGTTSYCFKAPAAGEIVEVNLNSNADIGAGTIQVKVMNGATVVADHAAATAFTGNSFTTETLTDGTFIDGDTIHVVVIGDGTLNCTITAQMAYIYGFPASIG